MSDRLSAHLHVSVGKQQVHDDVRAQQLHAVQSPLQASQLLPQLLPAEPLPGLPDVLPNGLPEIATDAQSRRGREGEGVVGSVQVTVPSPASSWCTFSGSPLPRVRGHGLQQAGKPAHQGCEQGLSAHPGLD